MSEEFNKLEKKIVRPSNHAVESSTHINELSFGLEDTTYTAVQ
jgi:hypothetical protein